MNDPSVSIGPNGTMSIRRRSDPINLCIVPERSNPCVPRAETIAS